MKIKFFGDTDTLYIEFSFAEVEETRDLAENTVPDFDGEGNLCALTVEHASDHMEIPSFSPSKSRLDWLRQK